MYPYIIPESPPLQAEVWGGSRWTDLAVVRVGASILYLILFMFLFLHFSHLDMRKEEKILLRIMHFVKSYGNRPF